MPRRCKIELTRRGTIEQPGLEYAILHDGLRARLDAFAVEWTRALAALAQRIVDDTDAGFEQPLPELVTKKTGLARNRSAVDGAGEMPDQAARDPPVEHDWNTLGRNFARIELGHRPLARRAPDLLRRIKIGSMECRGEIVVPLHCGGFARDRAHRQAVARRQVGAAKAVAGRQHHAADAG